MEQRSPITAFLVALAAFIIVVAGMRTAESLLVPFLLSLFVAVICTPPLLWLKARGVPGWLAMLIVILNIVIGGTVVGIVVGSAIGDFRQDLPEYQLRLAEITAGLFQKLSTLGVSVDAELIRSSFNPGQPWLLPETRWRG